MKVMVAGALHLDLVVRAPHLPQRDETVVGSRVDYVFGGKGGNQAIAAAAMGAPTVFAGRAGIDAFGEMLRLRLTQSAVDASQLQLDPGPSGMSAAIVDENGDYGAAIVSASNLNIDADAITLPNPAAVLSLQNEIPEAVNIALALKAKAQGTPVWLNAAPARALSPEFMDLLDLIIVNRVEAAFYQDRALRPRMLETLGKDGVKLDGEHHPGFPIEATSSHGAGDMFIGALAAEVCAGASVADALPFAQAAAALLVSTPLAARDHLTREAVDAFRAGHGSR
ncbi:MAG: PfkB family carbohydrate kinase [Roseobacter sp.]